MTRPGPSLRQISPPEVRQGLRLWVEQTISQPSRLAAGQRRDKRLAPQALNSITPANSKRDISAPGLTPTPSASPPPRGEGLGVGGTTPNQADPR